MEIDYLIVAAGFFLGFMLVQKVIFSVISRKTVIDDYSREIDEILTKEEHKVKGRFE